jgi:hypothetical protein
VLPENGGNMTLESKREYTQLMRERYQKAVKKERSQILDEFIKVMRYHRKAAIRTLLRAPKSKSRHRGRPSQYQEVLEPLKAIWEASDRLCSKRLQPFLPELIPVLKRNGELKIDANTEGKLMKLSAATIDRLLEPARRVGGRKPLSTTRPGSLLKGAIPIRTFADWEENSPGFLEIDTVAHCGERLGGFYLYTLCGVDVASGWTECMPVWGKWQERVRQAVHHIGQNLPFNLLGIDSDNGSEFINQCFVDYCHKNKITFTRSRSYKKNDSCHVEQKNGNVVRRLIGYDRYSSKPAYECLGRIYNLVRLYLNFFQPTMKLVRKTRQGSRVHKVYETALTPYRRLLKLGVLSEVKQSEMAAIYNGLNPVRLRNQINANLEQLWKLSDFPVRPVTRIMRQ